MRVSRESTAPDDGALLAIVTTLRERLLELTLPDPPEADRPDRGHGGGPGSAVALMTAAAEQLRIAEDALRADRDRARRRLDDRLAEDRRRAALWDTLPVPILRTDASGTLVSGNGEAAALLGVDTDALPRMPLARFLPVADRRALRDALSDLARGVPTARVTVRLGPAGRDAPPVTLLALPDLPDAAGPPGPRESPGTGEGTDTRQGAGDEDRAALVRWMVFQAGAGPPESGSEWLTATATLFDAGTSAGDVEHLLRRIAVQATKVIPGCDGATVTLGPPLEAIGFAAHGVPALAGDGAQATAGEGPSFDAYQTGRPSHSPDLRVDGRWPRLARSAGRGGARGVLAVPVAGAGGAVAGVLSLYADAAGSLDERAVQLGAWLSVVVATLLRATAERERLLSLAEQLNRALASRTVIEQAKGVVMATCDVDAEAALDMLRTISNRGNRRLVDVARQVIETRGRRVR